MSLDTLQLLRGEVPVVILHIFEKCCLPSSWLVALQYRKAQLFNLAYPDILYFPPSPLTLPLPDQVSNVSLFVSVCP